MKNKEAIDYIRITFGLNLNDIDDTFRDNENDFNIQKDLKYINEIAKELEVHLESGLVELLFGMEALVSNPFIIKNSLNILRYKNVEKKYEKDFLKKQDDFRNILREVNGKDKNIHSKIGVINVYTELLRLIRIIEFQEDDMTYLESERYNRSKYVFIMKDSKKLIWNTENCLIEQCHCGYRIANKLLGYLKDKGFKKVKELINFDDCRFIIKV